MFTDNIEYKRFVWELNNSITCDEKEKILKNQNKKNNESNHNTNKIVFICIGTNMVIGDSFGPIVGTVLKNTIGKNDSVKIIGDLENCITYNNIKENINEINQKYSSNLVIVLDAALSSKSNIGKVFIQNRGLKYGESLKKESNIIGNISIKAVVGENTENNIKNFNNLKKVSLKDIYDICNLVSIGIIDVMNKKENIGKNIYK